MTNNIIITAVLSLLSILLMLAEIFLLPGITIAGIAGALFGIGSIFYAYTYIGMVGGTITLIVTAVSFVVLFIWLVRSKAINKIGLNTEIGSKVVTDIDKVEEGDAAITLSRLSPIGKIQVNGVTVEGKSLGEFIDEGEEVIIYKKYANQVLVKRKNETNN